MKSGIVWAVSCVPLNVNVESAATPFGSIQRPWWLSFASPLIVTCAPLEVVVWLSWR